MTRTIFLFLLLLLVAGCADKPTDISSGQAKDSACLAHLDEHNVIYERLGEWKTTAGCAVDTPVRIKKSVEEWNHSALMSCQMADVIWEFETKILQPAAHDLLGHGIKKMNNVGAYACRGQRGNHPEAISEHAFGLAIDITGFELDDGTTLTILRDWSGNGVRAKFLHKIAQDACKIFHVVMTPNSNNLHKDHLHFDLGPKKHCGA